MDWYDTENNMEQYISMAEGFDGASLIDALHDVLPAGSSVLELGMGPGKDLALLSQRYDATGSDNARSFLHRYKRLHPEIETLHLDAVTLETERRFDAIYSNKVLHHLRFEELSRSFSRQAELLNPDGLALHSFWYGEGTENYAGMHVSLLNESSLKDLLDPRFSIIRFERYAEMEDGDSFYVILSL